MNKKQAQELTTVEEQELIRRLGFIRMVTTICREHTALAQAIQSLAESGSTGSIDPWDYTRVEVIKASIRMAMDSFDWWTRGILNEEQQKRAGAFKNAVNAMGSYLYLWWPPKSVVEENYWDFRNFFNEVGNQAWEVATWILNGDAIDEGR